MSPPALGSLDAPASHTRRLTSSESGTRLPRPFHMGAVVAALGARRRPGGDDGCGMNIRKIVARNPRVRDLGYRALRVRARAARAGPPPRILVNSFPKSGTHLVTAALDHFPDLRTAGIHIHQQSFVHGATEESQTRAQPELDWDKVHTTLKRAKPGQYVTAHFLPHPPLLEILEELGYRTIFVYRDPRDIVVSTVLYIKSLPRHPRHRRFMEVYSSDEDRMLAMITGVPGDEFGPALGALGRRLRKFLPWMHARNTLPCRFEDLVGEPGGGCADAQLRLLLEIGQHIHRPLTDQMASDIARRTWSPKSATFRTGMHGEWRRRFDARLRREFAREVSGELLAAYGYETDH